MTTTTCNTTTTTPFTTPVSGLPFLKVIQFAMALRRQRATLRGMDDAALQDLGLTRKEAAAESAHPVWDVPASWRR